MRIRVASVALVLVLASGAYAQDRGEALASPPGVDESAVDSGFTARFRDAHPPPETPAPVVQTSDWEGNLSFSLGAALVYELNDWPSAVLFGAARSEAAPGVSGFMALHYGFTPILEINLELGLRYLHFGDIAADDTPATPIADNVSILTPSVSLSGRLRPASRFYIGAGLGVGFGWLFGEARSRDGMLLPYGDTSGAVGELRGEVGFLLGPKASWDVGARLRFVGYPKVPGTSTLAVALELALTVPVWP
jgi:hypothetical protein